MRKGWIKTEFLCKSENVLNHCEIGTYFDRLIQQINNREVNKLISVTSVRATKTYLKKKKNRSP